MENWELITKKLIHYTWIVKNCGSWIQGPSHCLESPVFPTNDSPQWQLQIYTSGDRNLSRDFIILNLQVVSSQTDPEAEVKFAFVDAHGQMTNRSSCTHFYKTKKGWVYSTCVRRSLLFTKEFDLLTSDSLTVACEVTVQSRSSSQSKNVPLLTSEQQLVKDLSQLLKTNTFSDVTVFVNEVPFHSHKAILSARSPVFAAMFQNHTKENLTNTVNIPDMDQAAFAALLSFIYTGAVQDIEDIVESLFAAADKYQFSQLKLICQEQMCRKLTTKNAPKFLVLADMHTADLLKDRCIDFINKNSSNVIKTDSWKDMVESHPHLAAEIYVKLVQM